MSLAQPTAEQKGLKSRQHFPSPKYVGSLITSHKERCVMGSNRGVLNICGLTNFEDRSRCSKRDSFNRRSEKVEFFTDPHISLTTQRPVILAASPSAEMYILTI